ncbi:hypothetical protein [Thalassotalea montiporae]
MPYKITSVVLGLYALIGLAVCYFYNFIDWLSLFVAVLNYALLPALGAYWTWQKVRVGMLIAALYFAFQSIRRVSPESFLPHIAPISLSFPLGDFTSGNGLLIDVFAITMVIILLTLQAKAKH